MHTRRQIKSALAALWLAPLFLTAPGAACSIPEAGPSQERQHADHSKRSPDRWQGTLSCSRAGEDSDNQPPQQQRRHRRSQLHAAVAVTLARPKPLEVLDSILAFCRWSTRAACCSTDRSCRQEDTL
jgi:hypothetical protein